MPYFYEQAVASLNTFALMNNGLTPNEIFNCHVRITSYLKAKNAILSDTERLDILKIASRSASYPYEVQFKIAQLFVKYNTQLILPNWQYETIPKKVELEWLKACFLNNTNWSIDHTNSFHIQIDSFYIFLLII